MQRHIPPQRQKFLIAQLNCAKHHPLSQKEMERIETLECVAAQQFSDGAITGEAYQQKLNALPALESAVVFFNSHTELRFALTYIGVPDADIEETMRHEDSHYREAVRRGFTTLKFAVTVYRKNDGRLMCIPSLKLKAKSNQSDEEARLGIKSVTAAPEHLSDSDLRFLR